MWMGQKIRSRRKDIGITRNDLADRLHVTPSTIANYENGISYPKPDILISLIEALQIDANYLYQDYLSESKVRTLYGQELTEEEEDALLKYRHLSENGKRLVRMVIAEEYERKAKNDWIDYPCLQPGVRKLHCAFLMQKEPVTVRFEKKNEYEGMEFCFQIHVEQYEPVYKKYAVLAMKHGAAKHNQIGIFRLNKLYYLRTLYKTPECCRLHSLNVNEPDIEIKEDDQFECIGTVLGQVYGTYEIIREEIPKTENE